MSTFRLYRVEIQFDPQASLFEQRELTRAEFLRLSIQSLPSVQLRAGTEWHIGNVTEVQRDGIFFRIGKSSESDLDKYEDGNFFTEDIKRAPFTEAILDTNYQCVAIAKKAQVSNSVDGISERLQDLLNRSSIAKETGAMCTINMIKDPKDFLEYLTDAYAVTKFKITIPKPNAWDVDEQFVKPVQKALSGVDGDTAKTEVQGSNLNKERLSDISRSAASTGDDVEATIKSSPDAKEKTKRMDKNPVEISHDETESATGIARLLEMMIRVYKEVRG